MEQQLAVKEQEWENEQLRRLKSWEQAAKTEPEMGSANDDDEVLFYEMTGNTSWAATHAAHLAVMQRQGLVFKPDIHGMHCCLGCFVLVNACEGVGAPQSSVLGLSVSFSLSRTLFSEQASLSWSQPGRLMTCT